MTTERFLSKSFFQIIFNFNWNISGGLRKKICWYGEKVLSSLRKTALSVTRRTMRWEKKKLFRETIKLLEITFRFWQRIFSSGEFFQNGCQTCILHVPEKILRKYKFFGGSFIFRQRFRLLSTIIFALLLKKLGKSWQQWRLRVQMSTLIWNMFPYKNNKLPERFLGVWQNFFLGFSVKVSSTGYAKTTFCVSESNF